MKKRIVSMLVVLCMALAQLPVFAFASQEEPCITGISITVDGVTYTEGNVIIKPDSTVVYTVTGTNLDQAMSCSFAHTQGVKSIISTGAGWDVDATKTILTRDYSDRIPQFYQCDNFRVYYTPASGENVYTDIYLTFDGGPEPAQITNLDFIVDGVTYTEGNVPIKPDSEVTLLIHGERLYNLTEGFVIDIPQVYLQVWTLGINSPTIITYETPTVWFEGASDYPITYTTDNWQTVFTSDITVTFASEPKGPPEITGLALNVDGVTYTEGNVIVRPDSTVSFTVTGLNLDNVDQSQIIDTPLAYLPLHSISLQEDGTYLYTTVPSIFVGGSNYQITYTNDSWTTSIPTDIYVTYWDGQDYEYSDLILTEDTAVKLSLTQDLYVDLNGFDLSGTIITNGFKVYGMDSATNQYTSDTMGYFSCVDENGNTILPERFYTTADGVRYMTIETENGYTFHRFYLGITHLTLDTSVTGFGYKAEFYGDEMVQSQVQSIGYNLWLTGGHVVSRSAAFQNILTLRLKNFDVVNYGQTPVNACATMTLSDGTVLESATASYSMRQMVEQINDTAQDYQRPILLNVALMIQNHPTMETWQVANILAALPSVEE